MPADPPFELGHWHPVLLVRELGSRPKAFTLLGRELVAFRAPRSSPSGFAVLSNTCPHRRARLSDGHVEGERIVCPYHGFTFDAAGAGHSPGTPRMRLACERYETRVAHDALWVRAATSPERAFPALGRPGYRFVGALAHLVEAPLEPTIDNFCEVEHTPSTHALFGYDAASLPSIRTTTHTSDTELHVVNEGPQKPIPRLIARAFGVRSGDTFIDEWTVRFSPMHIVYEQWWRDPATATPRPDRLHLGVFFTPVAPDETRLFTFVFSSRAPSRLDLLRDPLVLRIVDHEVRLDQRQIERLADHSPDLRGATLGRFDSPLRAYRKRLPLYRGVRP